MKALRLAVSALAVVASACGSPEDVTSVPESEQVQGLAVRYAPGAVAPEEAKEAVDEAMTAREAAAARPAGASGEITTFAASADGRVYNVTAAVNVRSGPGTGYPIVAVAYPGTDLENDGSGGKISANGYTWVRVVYAYGSSDPCTWNQLKGWVIADPLSPGRPYVKTGPLNVRAYSCNGAILGTVPTGYALSFYQGDSQWAAKWYEVANPWNPFGPSAWVDGWDFVDVR